MARKSYILTGYNMKSKFYIETQVFTNKKIADKSYAAFINYLIFNHRLDTDNIVVSSPTREVHTTVIDGKYYVALRTFDISNKVIQYI